MDKELADLEGILERDPDNEEALYRLMMLRYKLGLPFFEEEGGGFIYLGSIVWDGGPYNFPSPGPQDLYLFPTGEGVRYASLMARYGAAPSEYRSGDLCGNLLGIPEDKPFWNMIYQKALEKGLIEPLPLFQIIHVAKDGNEEVWKESYSRSEAYDRMTTMWATRLGDPEYEGTRLIVRDTDGVQWTQMVFNRSYLT